MTPNRVLPGFRIAAIAAGAIFVGGLVGVWTTRNPYVAVVSVLGVAVMIAGVLRPDVIISASLAVAVLVPTDTLTGAAFGIQSLTVPRVVGALGVLSLLVVALRRERVTSVPWRAVDIGVLTYALVSVISVALGSNQGRHSWEETVLVPSILYAVVRANRLSVKEALRIGAIAQAAGFLLTLSIVAEFVAQRPLFMILNQYYPWASSGSSLFRPGGFLEDPPRAATVLVLVLASMPPLWAASRHSTRRLLAVQLVFTVFAVTVTFTRSALLALAVLLTLFSIQRLGAFKATYFGVAAGGLIVWAFDRLQGSALVQEGIVRGSTIAARAGFARDAVHAVTVSSPAQLIVGHGFRATRDAQQLKSLWASGTHNIYLTALLEQGVLGLLSLVILLSTAIVVGLRSFATRGRGGAAGLSLAGLGCAGAIVGLGYDSARAFPVMAILFTSLALWLPPAGADGESQ